jgi:hypothetical protein
MVVINLDEIFELALRAINLEGKIEILLGPFSLFRPIAGWSVPEFIVKDSENLAIVAHGAEKEKIVSVARGTF